MISAVLIVKDEAAVLGRCLDSLRGVADEVVVVDTGSTDGTVAIAQDHGATTAHFAWCNDFSAARNFALAQARGDVVFTIDADEYLTTPADVARGELLQFGERDALALGLVEIVNALEEGSSTDLTSRVFHRCAFRYEGAIHEQLVPIKPGAPHAVELNITLHHTGYALSPEEAAAKARRNIALLRRELAAHPHDEYYRYQLGKAWQSMGKSQAAAVAFEQALRAIDFTESPPRGRLGPVNRKVLTGVLCGAAYAHVANGDAARAVELLTTQQQLAHEGTRRADFYHALGHALLHAGRLSEAQAAHEAALGLPEDVRGTGTWLAWYHLGLLAEAQGHQDKARQAYELCREHWPQFAPAAERLRELDK